MNDLQFEIEIPSDSDGYVLLQCPNCGEFFKLPASEINSDEFVDIHCPKCGLVGEEYLTDDVLELAEKIIMNRLSDQIQKELNVFNKKNKLIKLSIKDSKREREDPITSTIESMRIIQFPCCKRSAKIKPIVLMSAAYCPYCGVIHYEFR